MRKSIIICLILCIIAPLLSEAKKKTFRNGLFWELKNGVLTISGNGPLDVSNHDGASEYRPWFYVKESIEKIIIEDGVTSIGEWAFGMFDEKTYFKTVIIGRSVKSIGDNAFRNCVGIQSLELPNTVSSIGVSAFEGCSSLQSIVLPNSVNSLGGSAFKGCTSLSNVVLSNSLTSIPFHAFHECKNLRFVIIPSSVKSIEDFSFEGCSNLISIEIPFSVTDIGAHAFSGCYSLQSIKLPSIKTIPWGIFKDCTSLKSIEIPNTVTAIKEWAFQNCKSLTSLTIPNSVTSIGEYIFYGCTSLQAISIPSSLTEIKEKAFMIDEKSLGHGNFQYTSYKGDIIYMPSTLIAKGRYVWEKWGLSVESVNAYTKSIGMITEESIKEKGGYSIATELMNGSIKYWKVSKGGRYGLTDAEGKVIVPTEMEALESAGTGYLRYKLNGFWGLMDYAGKIIIDTDRGYTSIGDFVTFTKRFPYTMTGYKGECDINGKQISKIKVETPKQNSSLSKSSSKGLTTQQNNGVYPFEYSESNSFYECQMKENKFLSLISSESFRIKISQQKNGNKYLVELYLNSLVTGSTVVKWSNSSPKTTNNNDLCTIIMTLSSGETLRIERCMMIDKRRKDFQNSDRIGAIGIMFLPFYTYPSSNNQSSSEREQYVIDQLSKYDIKSISYIGSTFSFESAKTASTIDAMLKSIRNHR